MGQVLHGSATTTEAVRLAIQHSQASLRALSKRYGIDPKTYDSHAQLRAHRADFVSTYNFARRLKTLRGPTPYEAICKAWSAELGSFRANQLHQMPGRNS